MTVQERHFTELELTQLDQCNLPQHIAIIPDGNRRWATQHLITNSDGHRKGGETVLEMINAAKELHVKAVTFYTFSTENWYRSKEEVDGLMHLITDYLDRHLNRMLRDGIGFHTIGDTTKLPQEVQDKIDETKEATESLNDIHFIMAINYGARDEICRAIQRLMQDVDLKTEVTPELFSKYLDTSPWGDPQLFIRTGGEQRLSNFLLWQISYAELYIDHKLWPDFTPSDLLKAILWYQQRQRRHGK
ncbi:MAG: isoprenyl transferase [Chlamydiales bacterium]